MLDSSFTLSFWTNLETNEHHSIFAYYLNDNDNGYKVHLVIESGIPFFHLRDIGDATYTTINLSSINFNTWENLTFTYNNGLWKYFVNGEYIQEFTKTISQLTYSKIFWCSHEPFSNDYCVDGMIDDISVYNRTLSDEEVTQLYANYYPPENFAAIAEEGYNKLTWDTSDYEILEKVKVYRDGAFLSDVIIDGPEDSLYTHFGVIPDTTYQYSINSVDTLGNESIKSEIIPVTALFVPFTDMNSGLTGVDWGTVLWGDYDNDGDLDVFLSGDTGTGYISKIYENENGIYNDINAGLTNLFWGDAAWGDYDNDGDLDILFTGVESLGPDVFMSKLYRNDSGNFIEVEAGLINVIQGQVAWGDYDNDGDLDILLNGETGAGKITKIYRNDAGVFLDINAGLTGSNIGKAAWGDYDNDGDLDMFLSGSSYGYDATGDGFFSKIYRNDNGAFSDINAGITRAAWGSAAWGDYDSDGDLDLIITGYTGSVSFSKIYRNDSGLFTDINAGFTEIPMGSVAWGDYDNDGDLDILIAGNTTSSVKLSKIYRNDSGIFTDINAGLTGVTECSASWGDYDNDGDLDILLSGDTGAGFISKIYRNNSIIQNTIPNSPLNLEFTQDQNGLYFNFDPATDAETPALGLTYNIDLDIEDDIIKTASSDYTTGYRRLASMGNIQQNTSWTLDIEAPVETIPQQLFNLNWKVQAIDNCFAGSVFASKNDTIINRNLITVPKETMIATDALTWEYVMPSDSIASYTLQMSYDSLFTDCFETSFSGKKDNKTAYFGIDLLSLGVIDSLEDNEKYYWRVKPEHVNPNVATGFRSFPDSFIYNLTYLAPSPVNIAVDGEYVTLSWNIEKDAEKGEVYNVYSSDDPHSIFPDGWNLEIEGLPTTEWITRTTDLKKFYCVTATSGVKTTEGVNQHSPVKNK
jgi:hypothetical protein